MVSAALTWEGVTPAFFINNGDIKVNAQVYIHHLEEELLPALYELYHDKRRNYIFVQDSAPAHRSRVVQEYLHGRLGNRFVASTDWPPNSPDLNPLDFYFWDHLSVKVYEGRHCRPFDTDEELGVWDDCVDRDQIRKVGGSC